MKILLVEDQEDQVMLIQAAFEAAGITVELVHVDGGAKCLAYLRGDAPFAGGQFPDLVLLDLNMPVMNGFEVLAQIAGDERLNSIPVVVLSTSNNPADVRKAYALGCSSYLTKPLDFDQLTSSMKQLADYWFGLVSLPGAGRVHIP